MIQVIGISDAKNSLKKQLDSFGNKYKDRFALSGIRQSSKVQKAGIISAGSKYNIKPNEVTYSKRKTRGGILRYQAYIPSAYKKGQILTKAQQKKPTRRYYLNIIAYSKQVKRLTGRKGGKRLNRGVLKRDNFLERGFNITVSKQVDAFSRTVLSRIMSYRVKNSKYSISKPSGFTFL